MAVTVATTTQQSSPFIKQLASSNRRIRDQAISSLRLYLQRAQPFTPLELLKLWKGLFYCMWMSDKPLNQQRLARDLADLMNVVRGRENFLGFVDAFWKTMGREWSGIDGLRMDKFLYLVRCYVGVGFEYLSRNHWGVEGLLDQYLEVLQGVPLNARDMKIPAGLRLHVIDLYVDELDKVDAKRDAPLETILAPLRKLGKETPTNSVRSRVKGALADGRVKDWQNAQSEEDAQEGNEGTLNAPDEKPGDSDDDEFGGFDD